MPTERAILPLFEFQKLAALVYEAKHHGQESNPDCCDQDCALMVRALPGEPLKCPMYEYVYIFRRSIDFELMAGCVTIGPQVVSLFPCNQSVGLDLTMLSSLASRR